MRFEIQRQTAGRSQMHPTDQAGSAEALELSISLGFLRMRPACRDACPISATMFDIPASTTRLPFLFSRKNRIEMPIVPIYAEFQKEKEVQKKRRFADPLHHGGVKI